jgi:hypothetical protein
MRVTHWRYSLRLRFRSLFRRRQIEQELRDELEFHLNELSEANIAKGMSPKVARAQALRAMEGVEQQKEACRDARGTTLIDDLGRDIHYGLRTLRNSPVFASMAVLSLALGIGANTAIFSLIDTLIMRPLPVPEAARLRLIYFNSEGPYPRYDLSHRLFESVRDHSKVFENVFSWSSHRFQIKQGVDILHVDGFFASGDYFNGLAMKPELGRTFTPKDDHANGGPDGSGRSDQ